MIALVGMASSIFTIGRTNAGFSDTEESTENMWATGSLDGRATYVEHFQVEGMNPTQAPTERTTFTNEGSLNFRYGVQYRKTGGDDLLCDALILTAKRDGVTVYDKLPLKDFDVKDFSGNAFVLAPFGSDDWDFTAELPVDAGSALEHLSCQWSFDFTAWQVGLPDATQGFSDVEAVAPHSITTGEWLTPGDVIINEVMWMGSAASSTDEWLELKNMTAHDIDLSNWDIENGGTGLGGHIEIPSGYSIKANGYFLITKKKWDETAIALANDLAHDKGYTHVAGMSLLNEGEQLTLENEDSLVIDSTPLGEWPAGTSNSLKQSMERNDIPGDGTLAANWHTCVSGAANGAPYWDATGNNFGTPLAANLSPIVMNEFVLNPLGDDGASRPNGEWIELYNILDEDIDVNGWYFTNQNGDQIKVTSDNTASGETEVPGKGTLVVYLEEAFLDNDADTLSLYAPGILPEDLSDDVREDTYHYEEASVLPEGKSFARFPDGEGIWLDPEPTPGDENIMMDDELTSFRRQAFEECFQDEKLRKDATAEICSPLFLAYIGMLHDAGDDDISTKLLLYILEMIRVEEAAKLLALLSEDGELTKEEAALAVTEPVVEEEPETDGSISEDEPEKNTEEETVAPVVEVVPEEPPVEEVAPTDTPVIPKETEVTETPIATPLVEVPVEEVVEETPEAKVEEAPPITTEEVVVNEIPAE